MNSSQQEFHILLWKPKPASGYACYADISTGSDLCSCKYPPLPVQAQSEGYVTETDGETSVVLDTNLTPELIQEGFVREIISKVQTMRKEAGFEVMDKIIVYAKDNDKIMDIMKANQDEIKREVLAENIILGEAEGYTKEWNINKEAVTLGVSKVQEEN